MSKQFKLHRNLLVCPGEKSCGQCIDTIPELAGGDIYVPRLLSERDSKVDDVISECPNNCLYLVVP